MLLKDKKVIVPENVMAREVGGEVVILNLNNEQYYGLDEIGAHMWSVVIDSSTIQEALESLHDVYEVELDTLRTDLQELIDKLVSEGLLEVYDS